jgi:hypothetical protein
MRIGVVGVVPELGISKGLGGGELTTISLNSTGTDDGGTVPYSMLRDVDLKSLR